MVGTTAALRVSMHSLDAFLNSVASKETKRQYRSRIALFLNFAYENGTIEEKAQKFIEEGRKDKNMALEWVAAYMLLQKSKYDARTITAGTLRNYFKPIRVFCEFNEIQIPWKRVTRGLPRMRKFGQDRAPTTEEIRKLIEYPDRRIKAIVLLMSASGIRVGAWDHLRWGHIQPMSIDGKVVAAKMNVYAGEPEEYPTFITTEAYYAIKEWMDLRAEQGEKVSPSSWVMRDLFRTATMVPA